MRGPAWLTPGMLASHVEVEAHVSVHYQGRVITSNVEVLSGTFESSGERGAADKVTMRFHPENEPKSPWDPLQKNGQMSHLIVTMTSPLGEVWSVDMGFFVHQSWYWRQGEIEVVALGLLSRLQDDPFPWPSSPEKGATLGVELRRLCSPHLGVADAPVLNRKLPAGLAWGNDRLEAVNELLETMGLWGRVESDMLFHVYEDGGVRVPVASYSQDDLLLEVGERGDERRPNVFTGTFELRETIEKKVGSGKTAKTEKSEKVTKLTHTVEGTGVFDPKSYGVVRELVKVDAQGEKDPPMEQRIVDEATSSAFRKGMLVVQEMSLSMLSDPRLEVGDVVTLVLQEDPFGGDVETLLGRVQGLAFDLTSAESGPARLDVGLLRW